MVRIDFEERITLRIKQHVLKAIEQNVRKNKDKYESSSHFIRAAINHMLAEDNNKMEKYIKQQEIIKELFREGQLWEKRRNKKNTIGSKS